jgi:hypothetical protein
MGLRWRSLDMHRADNVYSRIVSACLPAYLQQSFLKLRDFIVITKERRRSKKNMMGIIFSLSFIKKLLFCTMGAKKCLT